MNLSFVLLLFIALCAVRDFSVIADESTGSEDGVVMAGFDSAAEAALETSKESFEF